MARRRFSHRPSRRLGHELYLGPGRHAQNLRLVAVLMDGQRHTVAEKRARCAWLCKSLRSHNLQRPASPAETVFEAPPGHYRLREVIQDAVAETAPDRACTKIRYRRQGSARGVFRTGCCRETRFISVSDLFVRL